MQKILFLISLILSITIFNGCSQKKAEPLQLDHNTTISSDLEEDEELDDFEDEMSVEEVYDPLNGYNRAMTTFNDKLYMYILAPTARGYRYVVHKDIRKGVNNFFNNILYPVRLINNLLQGKFKNSLEETERFVINTTIGFFGFFDPAKSEFGIKQHNEDFGQTLGYYGVGAGPHIVLPFFGPSNLRDTFSMYPDSLADPIDYQENRGYNLTDSYAQTILLKTYKKVNYVSLHEGEYENLKKDAVDLYPYLRDVYEQYRIQQIKE